MENTAQTRGVTGRKFVFNTATAGLSALMSLSLSLPTETTLRRPFYFRGAHTGCCRCICSVSQLAGHSDPLLRATSWSKLSRTNDSLNFIAPPFILLPLLASSRFSNSSSFLFHPLLILREFFSSLLRFVRARYSSFIRFWITFVSCAWYMTFFTSFEIFQHAHAAREIIHLKNSSNYLWSKLLSLLV